MTRISDAYSAVVHLRVVLHVHQDQSFRRQDEFSRARMRVLVECRMSCFHDTGATAHRTAVSASVGLHTHSYCFCMLCARVSFIMSTKLGLVDMYIPARVYDSCMAWLRTVCHVSAFACTVLGLISTILFLFGFCGIWHLRHRRQRKCRRLQRACRNSFYRSGFLFVGVFSPCFFGKR